MRRELSGVTAEPEARAYLARERLAGLDAMSEIERPWVDEAIRRHEELDSGAARF